MPCRSCFGDFLQKLKRLRKSIRVFQFAIFRSHFGVYTCEHSHPPDFFDSASHQAIAMKTPDQYKVASRKPARTVATTGPLPSKPRSKARLPPAASTRESAGLQWTFLTNHSHVLVLLSRNPSVVLREVALVVGITERAVQRIIADLEAGGMIEREKVGRQNHYRIRTDQPLRHSIESHRTIGELLALLNSSGG